MKKVLPPRESLQSSIAELKAMPAGSIISSGRKLRAKSVSVNDLKQDLSDALLAESIGDLLREARSRRGMTGTELASKLGTSKVRVSQLEHAELNIELATLARVAGVLGYELQVAFVAGSERISHQHKV
jgi:ribosome-binding protein aMBF1 (putative translation factor)